MSTLAEICNLQTDKISFDANLAGSYVSTENMVPGKGGITVPEIAPKGQKVTAFEPGDVLVSNIRPYFEKDLACRPPRLLLKRCTRVQSIEMHS